VDINTDQWVGAAVALGVAVVAVTLLRFLFNRRRRDLPPEAETRLVLLERLVYAVVLVVGIAIALSKFDSVRTVGSALLTSTAIAAAVFGFAARQTLANVIAGLMLAVTQPLRLGDRVVFEEIVGTVEDVTLSYTFLRRLSGERIAIPNEKLAAGILRNDSLGGAPLAVEASVWIAPDADPQRALALAAEVADEASLAEATPEGMRIVASAGHAPIGERAAAEADLRARCLARLHSEGMLPPRA
jgi:small-conductance mechanosensitive channel